MVVGGKCELCVWDPTPHARFACPRVRTRARLDRACARLRLPSDRVLARAYAPGAYVRAVNYFARVFYTASPAVRLVVVARKGLTPIREWCNLSPIEQHNGDCTHD